MFGFSPTIFILVAMFGTLLIGTTHAFWKLVHDRTAAKPVV